MKWCFLSLLLIFFNGLNAQSDSVKVKLANYDVVIAFSRADYVRRFKNKTTRDSANLSEAISFFKSTDSLTLYDQYHMIDETKGHYFDEVLMYELFKSGKAYVVHNEMSYHFEHFKTKSYLQGYCNRRAYFRRKSLGRKVQFILDKQVIFTLFKYRNPIRRIINCI